MNFIDEFTHTGELFLIERLSKIDIATVFDVGANIGEWSCLVNKYIPKSIIHAFEIIPNTFDELFKNIRNVDNIIPNSYGLSDSIGAIQVKYCTSNTAFSTSLERMQPGTVSDSVFHWIKAITVTGDAYASSRLIDHIDLLKIDTEGTENLVLNGFKHMLSEGNIDIIQFEYGTANIISKWLLVDAYELLQPYGFVLGRLTPYGVEFSPYYLTMEDFKGPNIVAVHKSKENIINILKRE